MKRNISATHTSAFGPLAILRSKRKRCASIDPQVRGASITGRSIRMVWDVVTRRSFSYTSLTPHLMHRLRHTSRVEHAPGIDTFDAILSPAECADCIAETERIGYEAAPITTAAGVVMAPDVRNNTRVILDICRAHVHCGHAFRRSFPR